MKSAMILILFLNQAFADDFCQIEEASVPVKRIPVADDINFFVRGAPETGEVGFATNKGNFLLNTMNSQIKSVPGNIDPVMTPDGRIVSIPETLTFDPKTKTYSRKELQVLDGYRISDGTVSICTPEKGCEPTKLTLSDVKKSGKPFSIQMMNFYNRDHVESGPIFNDETVNFNYQSFGKLGSTSESTSYRLLFETPDGLAIRDYQLDSKGKKMEPLSSVRTVCHGAKFVIPSLSKSGNEFAAYDPEAGVTKIFEIGKSGADCTLKNTIAGLVGKVDFSPNSKLVAYHVDRRRDNNEDHNVIKSPVGRSDQEAVIFDREKKVQKTVARTKDSNNYYPVFLSDEKIAYIQKTRVGPDRKSEFALQISNLSKSASPKCRDCFDPDTKQGQLAAIVGAVRLKSCEEDSRYLYKNAMTSFSYLKPSQCRALVSACDNQCFSEIKKQIADESNPKLRTVGGITVTDGLRSVQKWNKKAIEDSSKEKLLSFCRDFEQTNLSAPNQGNNTKGAQ